MGQSERSPGARADGDRRGCSEHPSPRKWFPFRHALRPARIHPALWALCGTLAATLLFPATALAHGRLAALPAHVERTAVATALACAVATLVVGMFAEAFDWVRHTARTPLVTPRA